MGTHQRRTGTADTAAKPKQPHLARLGVVKAADAVRRLKHNEVRIGHLQATAQILDDCWQ
jgi:hypothetical protein